MFESDLASEAHLSSVHSELLRSARELAPARDLETITTIGKRAARRLLHPDRSASESCTSAIL
jgi:hypothetical protein